MYVGCGATGAVMYMGAAGGWGLAGVGIDNSLGCCCEAYPSPPRVVRLTAPSALGVATARGTGTFEGPTGVVGVCPWQRCPGQPLADIVANTIAARPSEDRFE